MKYLSIIEEYFSGRLNSEELEKFILEKERNSELEEEFEIYKRIFEFVINQEEDIKKNSMKLADFEFEPDSLLDIAKYGGRKSKDQKEENYINILENENEKIIRISINKTIFLRWFKISAIFLLLLGMGIAGMNILPRLTIKDEDLFRKYYKPYIPVGNLRSINEKEESKIKELYNSYNKGNYELTISVLSELPDSTKNTPELFLIEGISLIELKEYEKALKCFEQINENSLYYTNSLWYQGLCYLELKDTKNARKILKILESFTTYYQKESKSILKYL